MNSWQSVNSDPELWTSDIRDQKTQVLLYGMWTLV